MELADRDDGGHLIPVARTGRPKNIGAGLGSFPATSPWAAEAPQPDLRGRGRAGTEIAYNRTEFAESRNSLVQIFHRLEGRIEGDPEKNHDERGKIRNEVIHF